jgi:ABC-2 type transport system permease protein
MSTPSAPSFAHGVGLIAAREVVARLRSRSFTIQALLLIVGSFAAIVIGDAVSSGSGGDRTEVAVVQGVDVPRAGLDVTEAADTAAAERLVRSGDVEAAIVPSDDPQGYALVFAEESDVSQSLVLGLSASPSVQVLDESSQNAGLLYLVAFGFGLVFLFAALTFGTTIMQSVVEEKQTRVVEILMSAVSARALLAGKIIGNSAMALAQIVGIALASGLALAITGQTNLVTLLGPSVLWFVGFFAVGFVLIAALFAASASLVSRQEDVGGVTTPVMLLVMIPYFLVVFFFDDEAVLRVMSYVPISAPVGMPVRIFRGDTEWWEPLLSLAIVLAATVVVVLLGAKVYERSLLRTGGRVRLGEVLRG